MIINLELLMEEKIYGLKSNEDIEGFICIAFCNEVPQTMKE